MLLSLYEKMIVNASKVSLQKYHFKTHLLMEQLMYRVTEILYVYDLI
jgi:hypothetical protein